MRVIMQGPTFFWGTVLLIASSLWTPPLVCVTANTDEGEGAATGGHGRGLGISPAEQQSRHWLRFVLSWVAGHRTATHHFRLLVMIRAHASATGRNRQARA